jgi:hypothetical protein
MRGSEQLLGSGQKGDTHGTLVVASSECGKTELLKRLLLKFWHSFNNISLDSPSLGPSVEFAPEDDDWLLLKRIARDKKNTPYYQLDVENLAGILQQRTSEEQFRNMFSHVFWFCHPNLTNTNALGPCKGIERCQPRIWPALLCSMRNSGQHSWLREHYSSKCRTPLPQVQHRQPRRAVPTVFQELTCA